MAYKSNKEARAEYLEIEKKNRERNKQASERRKEKQSYNHFILLVIVGLVLYYLATHHR